MPATESLIIVAKLVDNVSAAGRVMFAKMGIAGVTSSLAAITKGIRSAILTFAKFAAIAAFLGSISKAVRLSREFAEAMGDVAAIADDAAFNIGDMGEKVRELAIASGQLDTVVARGLYQVISAGAQEASKAIEQLEAAQALAVAGSATTSQSVNLLTSALNAYRTEALDATLVTDKLFRAVVLGKTTVPELAQSMGRVLPVANNLGISLDEVTAAVVSLTRSGLSTREANTAVRQGLLSILNVSKDAEAVLEATGLAFDEATLREKGFLGILLDVNEAIGQNTTATRALFPNVRALTGILSLLNDEGVLFGDVLRDIESAGGDVQRAFLERLEQPGVRLGFVFNAINVGLSQLGDTIVKFLTGSASSDMKEFEEQLKSISSSVEKLAGPIIVISAMIQGLAFGVKSLYAGIQALVVGVAELINLSARTAFLPLGTKAPEIIPQDIIDAWTKTARDSAVAAAEAGLDLPIMDLFLGKDSKERMLAGIKEFLGEIARINLSDIPFETTIDQGMGPFFERGRPSTNTDLEAQNRYAENAGRLINMSDSLTKSLLQQRGGYAALREVARLNTVATINQANAWAAGSEENKKIAADIIQLAIATEELTKEQINQKEAEAALKKQIEDNQLLFQGLEVGVNTFTDAFVSFVDGTKGAKEAFEDFARSFLTQMLRMIVQALLFKAITASLGGLGGAFSSFLGGAAKGAVTGTTTPVQQQFAARGDVMAPGPQLLAVNEGPFQEAILPLQRNAQGILGVSGGGGGGGPTTIIIQAADASSIVDLAARNPRQFAQIVLQGAGMDPGLKQGFQLQGTFGA